MMNRRRRRGGAGTVETGVRTRPSNRGHLYRMFDRRNSGEEEIRGDLGGILSGDFRGMGRGRKTLGVEDGTVYLLMVG